MASTRESSSIGGFREPTEEAAKAAALREQQDAELRRRRSEGFRIFERGQLREAPTLPGAPPSVWLVDEADRLWTPMRGEPLNGYARDTHAIGLGIGWLRPGGERGSEPRVLSELEAQLREQAARQAEAQRKAQAAFEARRKQAQPVTASRLAGGQPLTLRQAAEAVEVHAGRLEVRAGRLVVHLPLDAGDDALHAAGLLYRAEAVVAACVKDGKPLPAKEATPAGALV